MLITLVEVKNYKKIRNVVIGPGSRSVILIGGKNKQGKSSLIGAMSAALGGGKEAAEEPIRKGQKSADIKIELDDGALLIHRRFLESGSSRLEVTTKDGKLSSPQKALDKIVGTRFLDPLRFSRLSEKEQREMLLGCVDLGIDLEEHAICHKATYQQRADANRDVKRLKAELATLPRKVDVPDQASPDELLGKLEELTDRDAKRTRAEHEIEEMRAESRRKKAAIPQAEKRTEQAEQYLEEMKQRHNDELQTMRERHQHELGVAKTSITEAQAAAKLAVKDSEDFVKKGKKAAAAAEKLVAEDLGAEIEETKTAIREATKSNEDRAQLLAQQEKRKSAEHALAVSEKDAEGFNDKLEELDQTKAKALAESSMPIDGLDIDEERVLYKEVPLSQASGAEQLQVSLAIAAALSPKLKDIWVEDGALLDKDSLELVQKFAEDNELRIWLERVGEADDDAIIIEEGLVKA